MVYVKRAEPKTGALKLSQLCKLKCVQNAHLINDIGNAPYHLVEPILKKKSAKSLKMIESNSPHIIAHSDSLWKSLIERDFNDRPTETVQMKNNGTTNIRLPARELYDIYYKEREKQRSNATQKLKILTKTLNYEKNRTKVKALNHVVVPLSNHSRRSMVQQQQYNSGGGFKSSLLQKAKHQNRLRAQFLGQSASTKRKPIMLQQVKAQQPNSFKQITHVSQSQLSSNNIRLQGTPCIASIPIPRPGTGTSPPRTGPTKRKIDLSAPSDNNPISLTKKPRHDSTSSVDEKSRKSNVYIYKT